MPIACFRSLVLLFAVLIVLSAGAREVLAQGDIDDILGAGDKELSLEAIFALMDKNGDGVVTRDELRTHKMGVFFQLDRNNSGKLSREDLPRLTDAEFVSMDADGDGQISGYEFNQAKVIEFEALDLDGDGKITLKEFLNAPSDSAK